MKTNQKLLEQTDQLRHHSLAYSKKVRNYRPSEKANLVGAKIGIVVDLLAFLGGLLLLFSHPVWGILLTLLGLISLVVSFIVLKEGTK